MANYSDITITPWFFPPTDTFEPRCGNTISGWHLNLWSYAGSPQLWLDLLMILAHLILLILHSCWPFWNVYLYIHWLTNNSYDGLWDPLHCQLTMKRTKICTWVNNKKEFDMIKEARRGREADTRINTACLFWWHSVSRSNQIYLEKKLND